MEHSKHKNAETKKLYHFFWGGGGEVTLTPNTSNKSFSKQFVIQKSLKLYHAKKKLCVNPPETLPLCLRQSSFKINFCSQTKKLNVVGGTTVLRTFFSTEDRGFPKNVYIF